MEYEKPWDGGMNYLIATDWWTVLELWLISCGLAIIPIAVYHYFTRNKERKNPGGME